MTRAEVRESDRDPSVLALRFRLVQRADGEFGPLDDDLFEPGVVLSFEVEPPGGLTPAALRRPDHPHPPALRDDRVERLRRGAGDGRGGPARRRGARRRLAEHEGQRRRLRRCCRATRSPSQVDDTVRPLRRGPPAADPARHRLALPAAPRASATARASTSSTTTRRARSSRTSPRPTSAARRSPTSCCCRTAAA